MTPWVAMGLVSLVAFVTGLVMAHTVVAWRSRRRHRCERFTGPVLHGDGWARAYGRCVDCGADACFEQTDAGGDGPYRTAQVPRDPPSDSPPPPRPRNLNHEACVRAVERDVADAIWAALEPKTAVEAVGGERPRAWKPPPPPPVDLAVMTEGAESGIAEFERLKVMERDLRREVEQLERQLVMLRGE